MLIKNILIYMEAYCSEDVCKLLKEKGFKQPCTVLNRLVIESGEKPFTNITHQKAMAWLREVHNIFIEISTSIDLNGKYHFSYTILDKECKYVRRGYTDFDWKYEDAVEAALKYSLENLI